MPFTIPDNDLAGIPARQSVWYSTDIAILVAGEAGTGVLTGCDVTAQGSPNMTLAVASGTIQPSAGAASVAVTAGNVTITTAHATLPRIDLVTASAAGVKTVTAGTAAAEPKPPALPSGHIGLAMVDVPAADTAIQTAQITSKRVLVGAGTAIATDAIWDAAGDLAVGTGADAAAKLTKGNAGGVLAMGNSAVIWNAGTSFPGSKATGDRFWRTDLGMEFYWDGTRWVSVTIYRDGSGFANGAGYATVNTGIWSAASWAPDFDVFIVNLYVTDYASGTNDGSNYWTILLAKVDSAFTETAIGSATTAADATGVLVSKKIAINAAFVTATYGTFNLNVAKTGSPGAIRAHGQFTYRLIAT